MVLKVLENDRHALFLEKVQTVLSRERLLPPEELDILIFPNGYDTTSQLKFKRFKDCLEFEETKIYLLPGVRVTLAPVVINVEYVYVGSLTSMPKRRGWTTSRLNI